MSTGPRRSVTVSSIPFTFAGSVTSRSTAMALPPEAWISSATDSERSRVRAARATPAPASTSAFANALPKPVLPPVTTAVLPLRSKASRTANEPPLFSTGLSRGEPSSGSPRCSSPSLSEQEGEQNATQDAADDRPHHGDPGVPPVVAAFARDGQYRVGDTRPQVAGGVDGVPSWPAEGEPDAYDEQADEKRVQASSYDRRGTTPYRPRVRNETKDAEDQHERTDDLGNDVRRGVVDRRRGAEHAELEAFVFGLFPVRQVRQPHDYGADESTEELRDYKAWNYGPVELAHCGECEG